MNWFPCNNHPLDKATYRFHITVPEGLTVAANGTLSQVSDNEDGTTSFVWQMQQPMASYLAMVAVGDFVEMRDDSGPVRSAITSRRILQRASPAVTALHSR